jgi:hypothetical protein
VSLSQRAVESQNAEATGEVWLPLVTISHPTLSEPIRVVNNNENITSLGRLFVAWDYELVLPGDDPENPTTARLDIGNIDPVIIKSLREIDSPPEVTIEIILATDPDLVEIEFTGLKLRNAPYDPGRIRGELAFEEITSEPVATTLTPAMFPGMF